MKRKDSTQGLRGHGGGTSRRAGASGRRVRFADEMDHVSGSSSEATESDDEAIAKGMMKLALACSYLQQQQPSEAVAAGNVAPRSCEFVLGFRGCMVGLGFSCGCLNWSAQTPIGIRVCRFGLRGSGFANVPANWALG